MLLSVNLSRFVPREVLPMTRLVFVSTIFVLLAASTFADTTWVGAGNIEGLWAVENSPYMIQGTVTVATGDTLTIGPGVSVFFTGPYKMVVNGLLRALGEAGDSIRFSTDTLANPARWRGLRFLAAHDSCRLEYVIIEHGRATGGDDERYGGGVDCQASRPLFRHSVIRYCYALIDGGGIYCRDNAAPTLVDCEIHDNYVELEGGAGIFARTARPMLTRCAVHHNVTPRSGGGIMSVGASVINLTDCQFRENVAALGGGLFAQGSANQVTFLRCDLVGNRATQAGGALHAVATTTRFSQCDFDSNSAPRGGAVYDTAASTRLTNCTLIGNSASQGGGAIYSRTGSTTTVEHGTFRGNEAPAGSAVYIDAASTILHNSILAHSTSGAGVYFAGSPNARVAYCDFFGHAGGNFGGVLPDTLGVVDTVNFNFDPCDRFFNLFLDPQFADPGEGDLRLLDSSRCIAAGERGSVSDDHDGSPRPNPSRSQPDMGAFESPLGGSYLHVCGRLEGELGPGDIVVDCNIFVETGDTLRLLPGTRFLFAGRFSFTVRGLLQAAGADSDSIVFTRFYPLESSDWRGLRFTNSHDSCRLSYCRIEHARGAGYHSLDGCGGVYCDNASPRLYRCTIRDNVSTYRGGGLACYNNAEPILRECRIVANQAVGPVFIFGGGVSSHQAAPVLLNCEIDSNSAAQEGGGVYSDSSQLVLVGCRIHHNAALRGGGVYCYLSGPLLTSSEIYNNTATESGGGVYLHSFSLLDSCVIHDNTAPQGGGVYSGWYSSTLQHCIFYGNRATSGGAFYCRTSGPIIERCTLVGDVADRGAEIYCLDASPVLNSSIVALATGPAVYFQGNSSGSVVWHSDFFGNPDGHFAFHDGDSSQGPEGLGLVDTINVNRDSCDTYFNIFLDPLLSDTSTHDYQIREGSPCINAGDPTLPADPDRTTADIGAFYFPAPYHPPSEFDLLLPNDGDTLEEPRIEFCWQRSHDPDPGDVVTYWLHLLTRDIALAFPVGADSCVMVDVDSLPLPDTVEVAWYVEAHSLYPDTTIQSQSIRTFFLQPPPLAGESRTEVPRAFSLDGNYPNPFNPTTVLSFALPRSCELSLRIFDVQGRLVRSLASGRYEAGMHSLIFNAGDLPSGIYFARLHAGSFAATRKMLLIR